MTHRPDESHAPVSDSARVRHRLVVPGDVTSQEIFLLAATRFRAAHWEQEPPPAGTLRLSRHTTISGPTPLASCDDDGLPLTAPAGGIEQLYMVDTLRERGDEVPFATGDRDGLRRAFRFGPPIREEARAIDWLIAASRRLTGYLELDVSDRRAAATLGAEWVQLAPDPSAIPDLVLLTDVWLTPETTERLAATRAAGVGALHPSHPTAAELAELHAGLDADDRAAVAAAPPLSAYSVIVPLRGSVDIVVIEVSGSTDIPLPLHDVPWATGGVVRYDVRWCPNDDDAAHAEHPRGPVRVARDRAATLIADLVAVLHGAAGGVVLDAGGFPIDPADL